MTWLASFAKTLSRRLATASRGFIQSRQSRGISGPAPITRQTQTPSLPPQLGQTLQPRGLSPELLKLRFHYEAAQNEDGTFSLPVSPKEMVLIGRAIRVCNREPRAIARYMQAHLNLNRGH